MSRIIDSIRAALVAALILGPVPSYAQNNALAIGPVTGTGGGGGGASGITIGTSVITSGTNTRVLFDDSGVVGEDAGLTYTKSTQQIAVGNSGTIGTAGTDTIGYVGGSGVGYLGLGAAPQSGMGLYVNAGTSTRVGNEFFGIDVNAAKSVATPGDLNSAVFGGVFNSVWGGSADSSNSTTGAYTEGIQSTGLIQGTASLNQLFGAELVAASSATGGHINIAQGVQGRVANAGLGGTITFAAGVRGDVTGASAITSAAALWARSVTGVTGAAYGVKIEDVSGNGSNFAFYGGLGTYHAGGAWEALNGLPFTITGDVALGANPALVVNGGSAAAATYSVQITGGGLLLDNNTRVLFKDSGGTIKTVFQGTSGDATQIRALGTGGIAILDNSSVNQVQFTASNGAWKVRNQTATTGVTRWQIQEGAGQTSSEAFGVYAADGTTARFSIANGSTVLGSAAIATNATDGFLYAVSGAGTPTGTPTTFTGRVPVYVDTTNSQLWLFLGGAWKQPKTPAGAAIVTWQ